jgi:hypothetical protein
MLQRSGLPGSDVVELAPGRGRTAAVIVSVGPRSYTGIDRDTDTRAITARVVTGVGTCLEGEAAQTGLDADFADVVVDEAMLTMQGHRGTGEIVADEGVGAVARIRLTRNQGSGSHGPANSGSALRNDWPRHRQTSRDGHCTCATDC